MGIIFIIAGSVGIILAFTGKNFTAGDPDAMSSFARRFPPDPAVWYSP
jgi:hypothetical protein